MRYFLTLLLFVVGCTAMAQNTFIGSTFSIADNDTNTIAPVSIALPSGIVSGDVLIFVVASSTNDGTEDGNITVSSNGGQVITQISNPGSSSGSDHLAIGVYYSVYNGTTGSAIAFAFGTASATAAKSVACYAFTKRNEKTTFWQTDGSTAFGSFLTPSGVNNTYTGASKTTTYSNTLVFFAAAAVDNVQFTNPASGWTKAGGDFRNASGNSIVLIYKTMPTAGASGAPTIDQVSATAKMRGYTIALRNFGDQKGLPLYFFQ